MYKGKKILALIPARGASKGVLRKNIKPLSGKPLIAWTIEEARKSKYIDRIIVSTEDKEIADISKKYGAEVPFFRPGKFAVDNSKAIDYILHTLKWLKKNGQKVYDLLILLQPTSPLRSTKDIDGAIRFLFSKNAKAIVSVCGIDYPLNWTNTLPKNGCMKGFINPKARNKNRQELPLFYRLNGAVYVGFCDYIIRQKGFMGNKTFAYVMPKERSIDIDDNFHLKLAEFFKGYD
ncbi:MAG: acylneuraminate cytidylyltransferase family protein [Candidatus Omnitrophica bacterium]|nr:acylneuraminate cytidylyltransferase family protein [Candidatus Omnitrophota bacterium]MDD5591879.1 acylneuraminate cytidylyltransferase family protein [Candidatus Omnitrophota bacterium]